MFDPHVTNLWPNCNIIRDPYVIYSVTQVRPIIDSYVTSVTLICNKSVTQP